jgi:hypothetical protein
VIYGCAMKIGRKEIRAAKFSLVFSDSLLGASFAPYLAQRLVTEGGLAWVGGYVTLAAAVSLLAVYMMRETHDNQWV